MYLALVRLGHVLAFSFFTVSIGGSRGPVAAGNNKQPTTETITNKCSLLRPAETINKTNGGNHNKCFLPRQTLCRTRVDLV